MKDAPQSTSEDRIMQRMSPDVASMNTKPPLDGDKIVGLAACGSGGLQRQRVMVLMVPLGALVPVLL